MLPILIAIAFMASIVLFILWKKERVKENGNPKLIINYQVASILTFTISITYVVATLLKTITS